MITVKKIAPVVVALTLALGVGNAAYAAPAAGASTAHKNTAAVHHQTSSHTSAAKPTAHTVKSQAKTSSKTASTVKAKKQLTKQTVKKTTPAKHAAPAKQVKAAKHLTKSAVAKPLQ